MEHGKMLVPEKPMFMQSLRHVNMIGNRNQPVGNGTLARFALA
jgi:hypothetical protein